MNALAAFVHHLAFVVLMTALVSEMLLLKQPLTLATAIKIRRYDMVYGIAAGIVLAVGLARVTMFEKGAAYYQHSAPFLIKMALFVLVGLISIYPTVVFFKWGKTIRAGAAPVLDQAGNRRLRLLIHIQLTLLLLMILCAALMAKGYGYFGA